MEASRARSGGFLTRETVIAIAAVLAIALHLVLRYAFRLSGTTAGFANRDLPLILLLVIGGIPVVFGLLMNLVRREFSSDLLAGISITASILMGEYLAGTLVVLMLTGGQALESYAIRSASSVLEALARRMPSKAHRRDNGVLVDLPLEDVSVGDVLVVLPHEICPVDGTVIDGHGSMDESYLTGEPYVMSKAPGSTVISGAVNSGSALVIRADRRAVDSRYAKIMAVMRESEQRRPRIRRLGDRLGAIYTPVAVGVAAVAWLMSGEPVRFLAVLVVATPCPLLIAIPVAIIGSITLAAKRGIIVRDPAILERIGSCRTAMFDKTGTLTYGEPELTEVLPLPGFAAQEVLALMAGLERYSRHPLAGAVLAAAGARGVALPEATEVGERPGEGLHGRVDGRSVRITSRKKLGGTEPGFDALPPQAGGMECVVLVDDRVAALGRFRDEPRSEGRSFVHHLTPKHDFDRVLLVSGDRAAEVRYLAERVGITEVHAEQTPEQKLALVRAETARADTVFVGDGINDAPALTAATVGIAFGRGSDITTEAAGAVILDSSLHHVDELLHIGTHLKRVALQSAVGGMALSVVGMVFAAAGFLPPVAGAVAQEIIDVLAVANALRAAVPPAVLSDYHGS